MKKEKKKEQDWALGIFGRILYIHLVYGVGVLVYSVWSYIYVCIL